MIKIDLQRLILQLIIDGYLKEDFRFTSYTTICYIKPGPRAEHINNENCQILIDIIQNTKKQISKDEKKIIKKKSTTTTPAVPGMMQSLKTLS